MELEAEEVFGILDLLVKTTRLHILLFEGKLIRIQLILNRVGLTVPPLALSFHIQPLLLTSDQPTTSSTGFGYATSHGSSSPYCVDRLTRVWLFQRAYGEKSEYV